MSYERPPMSQVAKAIYSFLTGLVCTGLSAIGAAFVGGFAWFLPPIAGVGSALLMFGIM